MFARAMHPVIIANTPLSQSEGGASERGMPGEGRRGFPCCAGEMSEGQRGRVE